jgi:hypothetical protein
LLNAVQNLSAESFQRLVHLNDKGRLSRAQVRFGSLRDLFEPSRVGRGDF